jgi:hypothetical protein
MALEEAWVEGRCESCALAHDPFVCPACRGHGLRYVPARDRVGQLIRQLAVCEVCGGEG